MKVFVSWSGERSKKIAGILCEFLAKVIQAVEPFYSPEIEKGTKWANSIDSALEGTKFGIVCLTPDNLESTWIHYETGALSKTKDAVIWTFLVGLSNSDVKQPLGKYQHTQFEKKEVFELLKSINKRVKEVGGQPVQDKALESLFSVFWEEFQNSINELPNKKPISDLNVENNENLRSDRDILEEILESIRNFKTNNVVKKDITEIYPIPSLRISILDSMIIDLLNKETYTPRSVLVKQLDELYGSNITIRNLSKNLINLIKKDILEESSYGKDSSIIGYRLK